MMQSQGGLLGSMAQGQPQQAPAGGLLGAMGGAAPAPQQGGMAPQGKQMAMQLAQNPTPQMVQQIIQQLHQSQNPAAQQLEQLLQQHANDPDALMSIAQSVMQSGG